MPNSKFPLTLIMLSVMGLTTTAHAAKKVNTINDPDINVLNKNIKKKIYETKLSPSKDGTSEIQVAFDGFPTEPTISKLPTSNQLVLDFGPIEYKESLPNLTPNAQVKGYYFTKSKENSTLMVVNLGDADKVVTKIENNNFIIQVNAKSTTTATAKVVPEARSLPITDIMYKVGKTGDAMATITLPSDATVVQDIQHDNRLVLHFYGTKFDTTLLKPRFFNNVNALVKSAKAENKNDAGFLEFELAGPYSYKIVQNGTDLTIAFSKSAVKRPLPKDHPSAVKKISLDFQNVETRNILQLLSTYVGVNIVASDDIKGNISISLNEVPWEQALRVILKTAGLTQRLDGDVIVVTPTATLVKDEKNIAQAEAQSIALTPLETKFFQLNYALAADVSTLIKATNSSSGGKASTVNSAMLQNNLDANGENTGSLLSPRGTISVDVRTNTLIVNDTKQKIEQINRIIGQIDIPVKQVMVEAKIVHANTEFAKALGVKWGVSRSKDLLMSNNTANLNTLYNNSGTGSATSNNVNLDLGGTVASLGVSNIAFGLINTTSTLLSLELAALQSDGDGEVLSAPRIMTGDKQPAIIRSGSKIPYQTTNGNNGTTTSFQDAVLELSVTPSITPDGNVQMKLSINKDTLGINTSSGYVIDTNTLDTNVLVGDGETVVLGGFYENTVINSTSKVPVLGDVPAVGALFKSKRNENSKQELLIFITPKIIAQGKF